MPIVMMSPVLNLREGADFAFGARWALMQHHPWTDRDQFLGMDDDSIKAYFRAWAEGGSDSSRPPCPWYVIEQYERENSKRLRGIRKARTDPRQAQPSGERGDLEPVVGNGDLQEAQPGEEEWSCEESDGVWWRHRDRGEQQA